MSALGLFQNMLEHYDTDEEPDRLRECQNMLTRCELVPLTVELIGISEIILVGLVDILDCVFG